MKADIAPCVKTSIRQVRPNSFGSLAMLAAIRLASSRVIRLAAPRRPGYSNKTLGKALVLAVANRRHQEKYLISFSSAVAADGADHAVGTSPSTNVEESASY